MEDSKAQQLLSGAQRFDLECLAEIYDRFSPGLYAYAMRLLGDTAQAEDCVAETFSRFLRALRAGQGPKNHLQAYLYRIAHNWITDQYRRQPPPPLNLDETIYEDASHNPEIQTGERIEQRRVRAALKLLTAEQRQVVVLKFIEGWGNEEVAVAIQKPLGAVKALQHRALASLRKLLLEGETTDGSQPRN
ncbi:MAG: sigma-70 family RNA polymerase sigma factor [Anaerolineae bacterium]|nr:sigma-70 family RNA polymerase sigma factor [Anaerolineae bacterium]